MPKGLGLTMCNMNSKSMIMNLIIVCVESSCCQLHTVLEAFTFHCCSTSRVACIFYFALLKEPILLLIICFICLSYFDAWVESNFVGVDFDLCQAAMNSAIIKPYGCKDVKKNASSDEIKYMYLKGSVKTNSFMSIQLSWNPPSIFQQILLILR